jgi:hypothetical protein
MPFLLLATLALLLAGGARAGEFIAGVDVSHLALLEALGMELGTSLPVGDEPGRWFRLQSR